MRLLNEVRKEAMRHDKYTEENALSWLCSLLFVEYLGRCFDECEEFPDNAKARIQDIVIAGSGPGLAKDPNLAPLIRAGMLNKKEW